MEKDKRELKTLKDIKYTITISPDMDKPKVYDLELKTNIKEEAIEWVKYWQNRQDSYAKTHQRAICQEFCYFFNLTKRDLK